VLVYSATDSAAAAPLIADFGTLYPGVRIDYSDLNSTEIYNKYTAEFASGADSADFVWSSAMDLQFKLASDGMALTYKSPEAARLPEGAVWQDQAFATTLEPFALVSNQRGLGEVTLNDHGDVINLLKDKAELLKGKVTTYDPEKSGTGFLALTQDVRNVPAFWELADALGKLSPQLQTSTGTMIEKVASGEHLFGYDIIGSYVLAKSKQDPNVGLGLLKDVTNALSRIAFIGKNSKRPNAAKLWLNYLLSKRGQDTLAQKSLLHAIRPDAEGEATAAALQKALGAALKPIKVGPDLLQALDQNKRLEFFQRWNKALGR
jgi:iron(III) transport system substrate-binding protein